MSNSNNSKSSPHAIAARNAANASGTRLHAGMSYRALEQRMVFDAALATTVSQATEATAEPDVAVQVTALAEMDQQALVAALAHLAAPAATTPQSDFAKPQIDQLAAQLTLSAKFLVESSATSSLTGTTLVTPVMEGDPKEATKIVAPICIMEPNFEADRSTVVFVDSRVADAGQIIAKASVGSEIVMIDPTIGGLEQIAAYLANRTDITAIHIISHGSSGALELGQDDITTVTLASHQAALASIGASLSVDGDILLYGCDVAQGLGGADFVTALARATGADVAASTDATGAAELGGNWNLELRTGLIEAGLIDAPEWNGLLAPLLISTTAAPIVTGATGTNGSTGFQEGGVGFSGMWTAAGTVGGTTVDIRATVMALTASKVSFFTQGDDLSLVLNGASTATIKWEMFATGTSQTIVAVGTPKFQISDIDGIGGIANTRETVRPQLNGLTSYTIDSPTNLIATTSAAGVQVTGTQNQNGEATSLTAFTWQNVSNWTINYTLAPNAASSNAVFRHDGDGDFTFVAANTVSLLTLDLDANNSSATGTAYQTTFVENGMAVGVADADRLISQHSVLGPDLGSAAIVLTNAQAGDSLTVGSLPTGIIADIDTSVSGQIIVTLTGTASVSDYRVAIDAIKFSNSSDAPSVTDRIIETSVRNTTYATTSNTAISTIHITSVNDAPTASNDIGFGIASMPIVVSVLSNDADIDGTLVAASLEFVGSAGTGQPLIVAGQGTWSVDTATGDVTFTPLLSFTGTPDPIQYTVADNVGTRSAPASIALTVMPVSSVPHLDLSGASPRTGAYLYGHNNTGFDAGWASPAGLARFANVDPAVGGSGLSYTNDNSSGYVTGVASTSLAEAMAQDEYISMKFSTLATMPETWITETAKRLAGGNFQFAFAISSDNFATSALLSQNNSPSSGPVYDGNSSYVTAVAADYQLQPGTAYDIRVYFYDVAGGTTSTFTWDDIYTSYSNDPTSYETTFTENGAAVPIADPTVQIEDSVNANMQSGLITLTNKQGSDRLLVSGVPVTAGSTGIIGGITYTVTETAGTVEIALSGPASKAAYQNMIKAITFDNASENPDITDRIIHATVNDGLSNSAVAVSTIHVVPLNDAPVVVANSGSGPEDAAISVNVLANDTDPEGDALDLASIQIVGAPGPGQSLTVAGQGVWSVNTATGDIVFSPDANYNGTPTAVQYTVADVNGARSAPTNLSVTVTPVNDNPMVDLNSGATTADSNVSNSVTFTEGNAAVRIATLTADINDFGENDVKLLQFATAGFVNGGSEIVTIGGASFVMDNAALTQTVMVGSSTFKVSINASGTFLVHDAANSTLPMNQADLDTLLRSITYENTSQNPTAGDRTMTFFLRDTGSLDSQSAVATITVVPANDAPVVINPLNPGTPPADPLHVVPVQAVNDGAAIAALDIRPYFTDHDHSTRTLTVDTTALPPGIVFDPATGTFSGTPTADASQSSTGTDPVGIYQVAVTATDPGGLAVTTYVTFNVGNVVPTAVADGRTTNENAVLITGNVLTNDRDGGGDTDALLVASAVNAANAPISIGNEVLLPSGAKLTLNSNGTYTYKPNNAFNYLAQDETATDTFTYTISDSQGGTSNTVVTITVDGRNDAPQAGVLPAIAARDGDLVNLNLGSLFTDPDTSNALTYTITGLPDGLRFDPATGIVSGILPNDASQGGVSVIPGGSRYLISIACSDGTSEISRSFYYSVTNPAPVAVADSNTLSENGPAISANVITANDRDGSDDSDPLVLASAKDSAGNPIALSSNVTLPSGARLIINADGSYTYDPGTVFNGLKATDTATDTFAYSIADGQGGTATATVTITITGANDAPVIINPLHPGTTANPNSATDPLNIIPDVVTTDGTPLLPIKVADFVRDPDGEPLVYALDPASTPAWIVVDPVTGLISGTPPAGASQLTNTGTPGVYLLTITATDPNGAIAATTVTLTIGNIVPVAVVDTNAVSEDGPAITGSALTNDHDGAPDGDVLSVVSASQNGNPVLIGSPVALAGGGLLTLNGDGSYSFDPGTAYNGLKAGITATEVVTYTISDGNGGIATTTLTLTINGVNDAPVVIDPVNPGTPSNPTAAVDPLHVLPVVATADGASPAPVDVGAIIKDPDGEPLVFTATGLPPGMLIDPVSGIITGTLPHNASVTGPYTAVVTGTDPSGATTSTAIVYQVVNLSPVADNDTGDVSEDGPVLAGSVLTNDHDTAPDSDPLTVTTATQNGRSMLIGTPVTLAGGGALTLNADGSYTFDPGTAYNSLLPLESATEAVTYTISDGNGGTAVGMLIITITGVNDAPVIIDPANPGSAANPTPAIDPLNIIPDVPTSDGAPLMPINVADFVRDPEGQALVYTLDPATTPAWLMIDPATGLITGTPPADASQASNTGSPGTYLLTIAATDPNGGIATTTVTLTIGNVAPVALNDAVTTAENSVLTGNVLADNGSGVDHDGSPDSDPVLVLAVNGQPANIGTPVAGSTGGTFKVLTDGEYNFDPGYSFDYLAPGETAVTTVSYMITDSNGGTSTALVSVTVTGANDTPLVVDPLTGLPVNPATGGDPSHIVPPVGGLDGTPITPVSLGSYFRDPDVSQPAPTLTVDTAQLPPGITFDPVSGTFSGTPLSGASQGGTDPARPGLYTVTVTATDQLGASVLTVVTFNVANIAPVALNDQLIVGEDGAPVVSTVLSNDHDGGNDGDRLVVVAINGNASIVGQPFMLSSGAILTLNADGSYAYDPNGAFISLAAGTTGTDVFTYTISDGNGGLASATVNLTILGENDLPVVVNPLTPGVSLADTLHVVPTAVGTDGQPITPLAVAAYFSDPDHNDPLTLSVAPGTLPPGISFDPATGTFTGTPTPAASSGGPARNGLYPVTVTATDSQGTTVTTIVTFSFRNAPPVAVDDVAQVAAGTTILIPVLANDRDGANDNDALSVVSATSPDGTVTITSDGQLSFTPNPGFAGEAVVTYTVSDGQGGFATAYLRIDCLPSSSYIPPRQVADALALRLTDPIPSVTSDGIVVTALQDAYHLGSIGGSIGTTGIIDAVANQISNLGGIGGNNGVGGGLGHDKLPRSSQPWSLERMIDGPSSRATSGFDPKGLTGFSLRFNTANGSIADGATDTPLIVLDSLVRAGNLIINMSSVEIPGHAMVVDYRVMQADGRPLPGWLNRAGQTLQGHRPADAETIKLKVIGILSDGSTVERDVIIQTISGEIQPLAGSKRADLAPLFSDQLKIYADAPDAAFDRLQLALAG